MYLNRFSRHQWPQSFFLIRFYFFSPVVSSRRRDFTCRHTPHIRLGVQCTRRHSLYNKILYFYFFVSYKHTHTHTHTKSIGSGADGVISVAPPLTTVMVNVSSHGARIFVRPECARPTDHFNDNNVTGNWPVYARTPGASERV